MPKGPGEIFEEQYGQGRLAYRESFPRLRRWLRPWLRDRFDVTRDVVARLCSAHPVHRLLDFGCGDGRLTRMVADAGAGRLTEIIGIDVSPSRIAQAQAVGVEGGHPQTTVRFVVGDESAIATSRGQGFDVALCIAVFGQVYDLYGLGRTLCQALRPGGYLVAEFANYAYVRHRLRLLRGRVPTISPAAIELWPSIGWDSGEIHYFDRRSSVSYMEQIGLRVESIHPTGLFANGLRILPALLATGFIVVAQRPE